MSKINQKEFNAKLSKKERVFNGKNYLNLVLEVSLNNGELVVFEIAPRFPNRKLEYKLKQNINEVK